MTTSAHSPAIALDSVRLVDEFYARFRDRFEPEGFIESVLARALRPTDPITVSQWADRYRILQSVDTDEAGPWRTSRTPYLQGIMDALTLAAPWRFVVFQKGAQIGATQAGNNFIGYAIHHAPGPIILAQPTAELAKRNSRQRIEPMIASSPELRERIYGESSFDRGQTILQKNFEGGTLVMTGANSAVGLRSMSARYAMADEVDGWPVDVDGEGDPLALLIARTRNFQRAKIYICSTPTVEGVSRVANWFRRGNAQYYFVPCPHCGEFQKLEFGGPEANFGLKWPKQTPKGMGDTVYLCAHCQKTFEEHHKTKILAEGKWRPTNEAGRPEIASFHLSSLYSPYGWYSWNHARDDFLATKDFPLALKGFVNTVLGETWKDEISRLDDEEVGRRRERYPVIDGVEVVPEQVVVMTGGVDVQDDRLELQTIGWGLAEEAWTLEYETIQGDPANRETWKELWERMKRPRPLERGGTDFIRAWCIDTAGHHTNMAYDFVRPRYRYATGDGRRMMTFGTIGRAGPGNLWPRQPSRQNKGKILLWMLKVDAGKETLYTRLAKVKVPGPGYIHFPHWLQEPFFLQLTAEEVLHGFDLRGFPTRTWQLRTPGRRNEALDTWVLAYAALCGLIQHGFDLPQEARDLQKKLARLAKGGPAHPMRDQERFRPPRNLTSEDHEGTLIPQGEGGSEVTTALSPEREVEALTERVTATSPAKSWQRRRRRSFWVGR